MLLNSRSMNLGKDGLSSTMGDIIPNVGSSSQHAALARGDPDMLIKVLPSGNCLIESLANFLVVVLSFLFILVFGVVENGSVTTEQ